MGAATKADLPVWRVFPKARAVFGPPSLVSGGNGERFTRHGAKTEDAGLGADLGLFLFGAASEQEIRREKAKARELRQSPWWKRRRSNGLCHYCGRKFPVRELTMDHIVPLARGGRTVKSNVVPCCGECNANKRSLLPVEWEEYMGRLADEESDGVAEPRERGADLV